MVKYCLNVLFCLFITLILTDLPAHGQVTEGLDHQEILTANRPNGSTVTLTVPRRAIKPSQLAILANSQDAQSVNIAQYYAQVRNIPVQNIIYLSFPPGRTTIAATEFNALKQQVDSAVALLPDIQAYVISWTEPWAVSQDTHYLGMSITSAFSLGFDTKYFNTSTVDCNPTAAVNTFNSYSYRPFTDFGVRPTMMLAGTSITNVKALIDKGKIADASFPIRNIYLVRTSDANRSDPRYKSFLDANNYWNRRDSVRVTYIDNSASTGSNYVTNKEDVLFYLTGLSFVANITTNNYLPGAIADHLTSYGGVLTGSQIPDQMPITRWLEAGVTGSYGTIQEPCAYTQKFPDGYVLSRHYFLGESLLEAYWKSVESPGEGIFVGDPLARPFGTKMSIDAQGQLKITSTNFKPRHVYSLFGSNTETGPQTLIQGDIRVDDYMGIKNFITPAAMNFYFLKEEYDPTLPTYIPPTKFPYWPVTNGEKVVWEELVGGTHGLYSYDINTKVVSKLPGVSLHSSYWPLVMKETKIAYTEVFDSSFARALRVYDYATNELKTIRILPSTDEFQNIQINQDRLVWSDQTGVNIYDLNTGVNSIVLPGSQFKYLSIDGDSLAFIYKNDAQLQVNVYKISTGTFDIVTHPTGAALRFSPKLIGDKVFWLEKATLADNQVVLKSYDVNTRQITTLHSFTNVAPIPVTNTDWFFEVSPGWIAWTAKPDTNSKSSIYVYNRILNNVEKIKTTFNDGIPYTTGIGGALNLYAYNLNDNSLVWVNVSKTDRQWNIYYKALTSGLVGRWDMEDVVNNTTLDKSGNNNTAQLISYAGILSSSKVGRGIMVDTNLTFKVPHSSTLELGKDGADMTVAFWMKLPTSFSDPWRSILHKGNNSQADLSPMIWISGDTKKILYCAKAAIQICQSSKQPIPLATWVHIAYVKSGATLSLYINGYLDSSTTLTGNTVFNPGPLYMGKSQMSVPGVTAYLDEVQIYNRALVPEEITVLSGAGGGVVP